MDRTGSGANNGSDAAERPFARGGRGSMAAGRRHSSTLLRKPWELKLKMSTSTDPAAPALPDIEMDDPEPIDITAARFPPGTTKAQKALYVIRKLNAHRAAKKAAAAEKSPDA